MRRMVLLPSAVVLMLLTAGSFTGLLAQQYQLKTEIQIGGEGGWDFLVADSSTRRVYVPHGMKVYVIDADKNALVQEIIPPTPAVSLLQPMPAGSSRGTEVSNPTSASLISKQDKRFPR